MTGKEGQSREDRVMGLLKEMEENMVREEYKAYKMLYSLEDKIRSISDVNLMIPSGSRQSRNSGDCKTSGGNVWTPTTLDPKRPWTQLDLKKINSLKPNLRQEKKIISTEKLNGDGLKENKDNDKSDTSVGATSSVQQLKLFWDKFFLTEMESLKSREVLDKNRFKSEEKLEILKVIKPKRKSMRRSAAKILEKSIPPSRVPISFRMVPAKQQNRSKKVIIKENAYANLDMINREVSTYVAKIRNSSDEESESDSDSIYTLADDTSSTSTSSLDQKHVVTESFKEELFKMFLAHQNFLMDVRKPEEKKGIYRHGDSGRQICCLLKKGIVLTFRNENPLKCYYEGVIVRQEEATFINSLGLIKNKRPEKKQRKLTTLLPCYYFTVQDNAPPDLFANGDHIFHLDPKQDKLQKIIFPEEDLDLKEAFKPTTTISYEKVTISTTAQLESSHIKLIISRNESIFHYSVLVIITFSSFTILGIIIIAFKYFEGSYFCY